MSDKRKIRVGITQGDINGIGYEVIFRTFENIKRKSRHRKADKDKHGIKDCF